MPEGDAMSQVSVKWVKENDLFIPKEEERGVYIPVVPLSALRGVVKGLRTSGDYTSDIYNQALNDILASLGEVGNDMA
jgi:hypothetical protein